jgi:hypothetical protein
VRSEVHKARGASLRALREGKQDRVQSGDSMAEEPLSATAKDSLRKMYCQRESGNSLSSLHFLNRAECAKGQRRTFLFLHFTRRKGGLKRFSTSLLLPSYSLKSPTSYGALGPHIVFELLQIIHIL